MAEEKQASATKETETKASDDKQAETKEGSQMDTSSSGGTEAATGSSGSSMVVGEEYNSMVQNIVDMGYDKSQVQIFIKFSVIFVYIHILVGLLFPLTIHANSQTR